MSLFKARDWWSTWAGSEEDFDLGCLCVANIDNDSSPSGKDAEKADIDFVQLVYFVLFQCSTPADLGQGKQRSVNLCCSFHVAVSFLCSFINIL
jgi:hypothetical protein